MIEAVRCVAAAAAAALLALSPTAPVEAAGKQFTFSEKLNARMADKLGIPPYFALPTSARVALPGSIDTSDMLLDFKHPDAKASAAGLGLRLVVAKRAGLAQRLAKSGLVQTGDLLLSFRPEWGGAGAYPNVQLGISHTGVAYVKGGLVRNLDNPLTEEYLGPGMRADLTSAHYKDLKFIHVVRPRNLSAAEKTNIAEWASRFNSSAKRVYPSQISFNQDYNAPKYRPGKPIDFVTRLGQIGLGQNPTGTIDMFCSEFVWSFLALRGCDPKTSGDAFKSGRVPACVKQPMDPMDATGTYVMSKSRSSYTGLADGPLVVIDQMKLPDGDRSKLLSDVFVEVPAELQKMSPGHRALAESMQPKFAKLQSYYLSASGGPLARLKARLISKAFSSSIPENYSPTSFLVNTLLPPDNAHRTMDYVATIVIE